MSETEPGPPSRSGARLAAAYLVLQALAVAAWWLVIVKHPAVRAAFRPDGFSDRALASFWLADGVLVIGGSLLAALLLALRARWLGPVLWLVSGAVAFGALYTLGELLLTGQAWPAVAAMAPAAAVTGFIAGRFGGPDRR